MSLRREPQEDLRLFLEFEVLRSVPLEIRAFKAVFLAVGARWRFPRTFPLAFPAMEARSDPGLGEGVDAELLESRELFSGHKRN